MKTTELNLKGAYLIEHDLIEDERGYFYEWFNKKRFQDQTGIDFNAIQFNCSKSTKGVLRGMHYQKEPHAQAKVIGVNKGEIQDVIIDMRVDSDTYLEWYSEILSAENKKKLFVPKGFAHGFLVISEEAEIFYAIDDYYAPASEAGVMFNDPNVGINWAMTEEEILLSAKDKKYGLIKN